MNEFDVVFGVLVSSGAGMLMGKHFERKKAQVAFNNFQRAVMTSVQATTLGVMDVMHERLKDVSPEILVKEVMAACRKRGAQVLAFNTETNRVMTDDDNKAE